MAQATVKEKAKQIALPEGRLINHSLFKRDAYQAKDGGTPGLPSYKIEMAYPKGTLLDNFFAELEEAAVAKWGAKVDKPNMLNIDGGFVISGVKDGDQMAGDREAAGKAGDAYKGHWVIRANTQYNKNGAEGDGGACVYDEGVTLIEPVGEAQVYPGCYGVLAVTIGNYMADDKVRNTKIEALKCYLVAFQKTRDGERLVASADHSSLFKPVGRTASVGAPVEGRRQRKG